MYFDGITIFFYQKFEGEKCSLKSYKYFNDVGVIARMVKYYLLHIRRQAMRFMMLMTCLTLCFVPFPLISNSNTHKI